MSTISPVESFVKPVTAAALVPCLSLSASLTCYRASRSGAEPRRRGVKRTVRLMGSPGLCVNSFCLSFAAVCSKLPHLIPRNIQQRTMYLSDTAHSWFGFRGGFIKTFQGRENSRSSIPSFASNIGDISFQGCPESSGLHYMARAGPLRVFSLTRQWISSRTHVCGHTHTPGPVEGNRSAQVPPRRGTRWIAPSREPVPPYSPISSDPRRPRQARSHAVQTPTPQPRNRSPILFASLQRQLPPPL